MFIAFFVAGSWCSGFEGLKLRIWDLGLGFTRIWNLGLRVSNQFLLALEVPLTTLGLRGLGFGFTD